jgi:hypothetical protein
MTVEESKRLPAGALLCCVCSVQGTPWLYFVVEPGGRLKDVTYFGLNEILWPDAVDENLYRIA